MNKNENFHHVTLH